MLRDFAKYSTVGKDVGEYRTLPLKPMEPRRNDADKTIDEIRKYAAAVNQYAADMEEYEKEKEEAIAINKAYGERMKIDSRRREEMFIKDLIADAGLKDEPATRSLYKMANQFCIDNELEGWEKTADVFDLLAKAADIGKSFLK